jgi:hypothetical protein
MRNFALSLEEPKEQMGIEMKTWSRVALVGLVSASIVVSGSVASIAYPSGQAMFVTASRVTAGIIAGNTVTVAAHKVKPGCIVTLSWDDLNKSSDRSYNYPWLEAVSSGTGNTPRQFLRAPKIAGDYSILATTESDCVGNAQHNPAGEAQAGLTVRVGTRVRTAVNGLDTSKLATRGSIVASGNFGTVASQRIVLRLFDITSNKTASVATVQTAQKNGAFSSTFRALNKAHNYRLDVTYAPTAKYFIDAPNGTISVTRVRVVR